MSALARVEVPSALWRKHRDGGLDTQHVSSLVRAFEFDYSGLEEARVRYAVIEMSAPVLEEAAAQVVSGELRTLDALQLASAIVARRADLECDTFVCFDSSLRKAAALAGFTVVP